MSWRDQLRPASFRGVPFHVEGSDIATGRRQAKREYPGRDEGYVRDMGRRLREHSIDGYVIGDDYMAARDRLIAASEKAGPGTLVHPWLGTRRVSLDLLRTRESSRQGGFARLTFSLIEAGTARFPMASADTGAKVAAAADAAKVTSQTAFEEGFSTGSSPAFVALAAGDEVDQVGGEVEAAARKTIPDGRISAALRLAVDALRNGKAAVNDPAALAADIAEVFGLAGALGEAAQARRVFSEFGTFASGWQSAGTTTPSRTIQTGNQASIIALTRRLGLIEAARASASEAFDSYQAATTARDSLAADLDTAMDAAADAGDDQAYAALRDLRTATVLDITTRAADLARVFEHTLGAPTPALVVAHRLYQSIDRADDIVARNAVRHPGFVPARTLEVLTV